MKKKKPIYFRSCLTRYSKLQLLKFRIFSCEIKSRDFTPESECVSVPSVTSKLRSVDILKMPRKELLSKTINDWLVRNDVIWGEKRHFGLVS